MKKVIFIISLLISFVATSQIDAQAPKYDITRPNPKTTAELGTMTRMVEGSEAWNTDTNTIWRYVLGVWTDTGTGGGATDHGALTGLTDDDHTQYHTDARAQAWLTSLYANLDTDSTDDFDGDYNSLTNLPNLALYALESEVFKKDGSTIATGSFDLGDNFITNITALEIVDSSSDSRLDLGYSGVGAFSFVKNPFTGVLAEMRFYDADKIELVATTVEVDALSGTGDRMVVANATGELSTQTIPSGGSGGGKPLLEITPTQEASLTAQNKIDNNYIVVETVATPTTYATSAELASTDAIVSSNQTEISNLGTEQASQGNRISTNETDIADIQNTLANPVTSVMTIDVKTAAYAPVISDAQDGKVLSLDYNDEILTLDAGVFATGNAIRIIVDDAATGTAHVVNGTDVDIVGYTDGFTLDSYPSGVTLVRKNANTAPEEWIVVDASGTLTDYVICLYAANEFHNVANAASLPICKEVDAVTGWISARPGDAVMETTTDSNTGTYALRGRVTTAQDNKIQYSWSATIGDTFTITGDFKEHQGEGARIRNFVNLTVNSGPIGFNIPLTYNSYSWDVTADATGTCTFNIDLGGFGAAVGDGVDVDSFTVIKTN